MNASQWAESLRVVYCLHISEFEKIFGGMGEYMADKFFETYKKDVFKFITYLDSDNQKLLFDYVMIKIRKNEMPKNRILTNAEMYPNKDNKDV